MKTTWDTETTSKNPLIAELVTVQITCDAGTYLWRASDGKDLSFIKRLWTDPTVEKCLQNGAYDIQILERVLGAAIVNYSWDTMLAEHLLHEETHYNLELLRGIYTNQPVYERELRKWKEEKIQVENGTKIRKVKTKVENGFTKKGKPKFRTEVNEEVVTKFKTVKRGDNLDGYSTVPHNILVPYGVYDSQTTHLIRIEQEKRLSDNQKGLLRDVVLPMQLALKDMEREGILVDVARLPAIRDEYIQRLKDLETLVHKEADEEFKISSPADVKRVLFEELRLPQPPIRSKKTGVVSSGKKALDWLSSHANHPVIAALEEWRATDQLLKAFLGRPDANGNISKSLMANLTAENRLHTSFRMTLETGRNSSSPNLQNLPVESKGPIRELFIAEEGSWLLQADYSQIELRVAAYESGDKFLIGLLESGGDVHTIFARKLYPFEPTLPDKEWRKKYDAYRTLAKRFTFGRLFGQSESGMALTFNISLEEAERFQAVYAELFPGMAEWWDRTIHHVRSGLPLETRWHRFRRFPAYSKFADIQWRGKNGFFGHLDREALNFIPQATAADILNCATGNIGELIRKYQLPMHLRLVVHDSLTVECPISYAEKAAAILKSELERVANERFGWLTPVEIKKGRTWLGELGLV